MIKTERSNKAIVKFEGTEIRKLTINDKDYFIAKDVFDALGENNYYYVLTNKIDGHEITKFPKFTKRKSPLFVSSNGIREIADYYDTDKSYSLNTTLLGEDNHPKVKTENKVIGSKQKTKNNDISDNLVIMKERQAVTSSLQVTESFNKNHQHVLRSIDGLKKDVSNFGQMFIETNLPDSYGRDRKAFYMNRDGFTLLAMGFTGKKALEFKLKYIDAFNKMEKQIINQPKDSYMINDPVERAKRWIEEETEREQLTDQNKVLLIEKEHNKKPLSYYNKILNSSALMSITQIAKDYGMTGHRMNTLLHDLGVQYKQSGVWLLYSQYQELGWTQSTTYVANEGFPNETVNFLTIWTQKGRLALYKLLKENNIVPMVEKVN